MYGGAGITIWGVAHVARSKVYITHCNARASAQQSNVKDAEASMPPLLSAPADPALGSGTMCLSGGEWLSRRLCTRLKWHIGQSPGNKLLYRLLGCLSHIVPAYWAGKIKAPKNKYLLKEWKQTRSKHNKETKLVGRSAGHYSPEQ